MRKCWNCGQPTNDETSRVCSDEICQRAEKKSSRGAFKNRNLVNQHKSLREYHQRPEVKERRIEWMREYYQRPEVKEKIREYQRKYSKRPEVKAKRRERYRHELSREKVYQREYIKRPEVKAKIRERYKRLKKLREEE